MNDDAIIWLIQNGNTEAYAQLVKKYHKNILAFIFRLIRDPHLTEDIGQDVFLYAYKSLSKFNPEMGTPFGAWLYFIARNRCISYFRTNQGARNVLIDECKHLSSAEDTVEKELIRREGLQALTDSLEELSEPFRTTIIKSLQGASLREIALECGIPLSTVKSRLFRAKQKIKLLMKGYIRGVSHEGRI